MAVDYAARARSLISQSGGFRAASTKRGARGGRRTALPRTTLTRVASGGSEPSRLNKDRINRAFRRLATDDAKEREKAGMGPGVATVDERTARGLERAYRKAGVPFSVVATADYGRQIGNIGEPSTETEYGRGSTVDEAKQNLDENFGRLREKYPNWTIKPDTKVQYRVYQTEA